MTSHTHASLADLLKGDTLRVFQEGLADITSIPAVICDANGRPAIGASGPPELLEMLQSTAGARDRINAILAHLTTDPEHAVRSELSFMAAAIHARQRPLGAIIIGGLPGRTPEPAALRRIVREFDLEPACAERLPGLMRAWTAADRRSAGALLRLLAGLLGRLAETAADLRTREDEIGTVHDIVNLVSGTRDTDEILTRLAAQVCDVMKVKASSIRLLDKATGELRIKAVHNLSDAYVSKGAVLVDGNPIDRAALDGEVVYVEDAATDPRSRFRDHARAEGIVSGLSVGMTYRGETLGVMRIYTAAPYRFSAAEAALLRSIASQAAAALTYARLYTEALGARRYQRQLRYAGTIQRRMIPVRPPQFPGVELAAVYEPSSEVGGDFFDFFDFQDSEMLGVCIADVVGKGIPAALMMAALRTAFRLYLHATLDIPEAMTMTNLHMCQQTLVGEFATLFCGVFENRGRQLVFCNAGHDPPLLCRDGQLTALENRNFIIGVSPTECYTARTIALHKGDTLLFYTDGLVDAVNFAGEPFGRERLADSLRRLARDSAGHIARNLIWDVRRFIGLADQADDITLVAARIV